MNKLPVSEINKLKLAISNVKSIVITGHQNPDADCIGSNLGLFHFLTQSKENVKVIMPNRFPENLKWMRGADEILVFEKDTENCQELIRSADLIFSLDYNDLNRVGKMQESLEKATCTKVIIDHHPQPGNQFDIVFSDTSVSSASELVFAVIKELCENQEITDSSAESILAGIIADTGCFAYNSSTPETYTTVANLLSQQVDKDYIKSKLFDNYSINRTRLMGYLLSEKMVVLPEYRTAYIILTNEEKEKFGYKIGDSEGFVNLPHSIENIIFSVFIMEHEGFVKMSLRSKGSFDVNMLSRKYFNGGGHKNAAGGKEFDLSVDETAQKLINLLPIYKEELLKS